MAQRNAANTGIRGVSRRTFLSGAVAVGAGLYLVACSSDESGGGSGGGGAEGGQLRTAVGGTGNHTWAPHEMGSDSLAPAKMMFDSLVDIDPDTQRVVGMLAESFSVSEDGKTWNFKLRPDVKFHGDNGTVTADDVKFTYGEWMREDSNQNTGPQLNDAIGGDLNNIEVVGPLEFNIHLAEPDYDLANLFVHSYNNLFVTSKKYVEADPDAASHHPIGTGPWEFVDEQAGVKINMKAFKDYCDTAPSYATLAYQAIPDGSARLLQVQSNAIDIASLEAQLIPEAQAASLRIIPVKNIGTLQVILGGMYYLPAGDPSLPKDQLDHDAPWIQDPSAPDKGKMIRQAMSMAINRQQILDTILAGYGRINYAPLIQYNDIEGQTDPSWKVPEFNLDGAKKLLADGGFPNGFPIQMFLYQDDVDTKRVGEAIAGMWEALGLQVERKDSEEDVLDPLLNKRETAGMAWVKLQGIEPLNIVLDQYASHREDGDYKINHPIIDKAVANYEKAKTPEEKAAVQKETNPGRQGPQRAQHRHPEEVEGPCAHGQTDGEPARSGPAQPAFHPDLGVLPRSVHR
jgi:peptide/nickel transport system substrate-binding protein